MARILISEPEPETHLLLERLVGRLGHHVVHDDADVLLLEPSGSGPLALARARMKAPEAALVLCSIEPMSGDRVRSMGAAGWLLKPFGLAELRGAIEAAIAFGPMFQGSVVAQAGGAPSSALNLRGLSGRAK